MAGKVIDFDRWRAERAVKEGEEQGPVFRIGGKEYPLPPEPPATVAVDVIRLKETLKDGDASVPLSAFVRIGTAMFGRDAFRTMLEENNVGAAELGDLILQAFGAWNVDIEDEEGKARPNRSTRRRKPSTS